MENQAKSNYFNLTTTGVGYLSRIRDYQPKKGAAMLNVTVGFLVGESSETVKPETRYVDCVVRGKEAKALLEQHREELSAEGAKVCARVEVGDIYGEMKEYKGEVRVFLKARLLRIFSLKLNGQVLFQAAKEGVSEEAMEVPSFTAQTPKEKTYARVIRVKVISDSYWVVKEVDGEREGAIAVSQLSEDGEAFLVEDWKLAKAHQANLEYQAKRPAQAPKKAQASAQTAKAETEASQAEVDTEAA